MELQFKNVSKDYGQVLAVIPWEKAYTGCWE